MGVRGNLRRPNAGGLLVQEIELQNADMYGQPFSIVQGPDEVPAT
jgi:hypothetical protein